MNGIVVVGASWGGLKALSALVCRLPADFPFAVAVVQHRGRDAESLLGRLLQDRSELQVFEVEDKQPIEPGTVYIAPPDYHLLVDDKEFSLSTDPLVRYSRPSIDVMFASAADSHGARTIGIVLTGANDDGAAGLKQIVARGGKAIVQDPDTAEVRIMPEAALRAVPSATVLKVPDMAAHLVMLAQDVVAHGGAR